MKDKNQVTHRASVLASATRGFTLIELLTVIAIIGILAAILIPVVGRVRDQARLSQCTVNLREIGSAIHVYSNDHNDWFPPHIRDYQADPTPDAEWGSRVGPDIHGVIGLLVSPERGGTNIPNWAGDYVDSIELLFCPALDDDYFSEEEHRHPEDIDGDNPILRAGYMWIYRPPGFSQENSRSTAEDPNRPFAFDFPAPNTAGLRDIFTYDPHNGSVNVLHIGGHVTRFSTDELTANNLPVDPGGNRLFDYFTFRRTDLRH